MSSEAKVLRMVVASPGDVQAERDLVAAVVDQVNHGVAKERGIILQVSRWEKDSFPGFHAQGPQGLIDSILQIPDCDIFIGIFWKRFGTAVTDAQSGTEHEYKLAYEAWKQRGQPQIFFYFNQKPYSPKSREETDQWGMVLDFQMSFPKEGLWWPYKGKQNFAALLRDHLENYLRSQFPLGGGTVAVSGSAHSGALPARPESAAAPVAQQRVLDAALAKHVPVGRATELLAMIRTVQSGGLKAIVEADVTYSVDKEDIRSKPFRVEFPVDAAGAIRAADVVIKVEAPDFRVDSPAQALQVPPEGDSEVVNFLLTALRPGELIVNLQVYQGEVYRGARLVKTQAEVTDKEISAMKVVVSMPMEVAVGLPPTLMFSGLRAGAIGPDAKIERLEGLPAPPPPSATAPRPAALPHEGAVHPPPAKSSGSFIHNVAAPLPDLLKPGADPPATAAGPAPPMPLAPAPLPPGGGGQPMEREWPTHEASRQESVPPPTYTGPAIHQLPPPPRDFVGRGNELLALEAATQEGGATLTGLRGMGGVGKTALALKLAQQLTPRYPDAQIFLDLRGASEKPLTAGEALAFVLRGFDPEARLPESEAELAARYRSTLHGKRALLLMDNARDAAQVEPLLPPAGSALIVTSRNYLEVPGLGTNDLGTLPPDDARSLLQTIAPRIGTEAVRLAKLCGYLPLALRSVASNLAKRVNISPQEYAQRLAAGGEKIGPVDASLGLSYDLLGGELQKLFRMLSVFPDSFDLPAAAAVWELAPAQAETALGDLIGYSLLEWNAEQGRCRLHDLVRKFAGQKLTADERGHALPRHAQYYLEVLHSADDLYLEGGDAIKLGLCLYDLEAGNIKAGQAWAAENTSSDKEAAHICSDYPNSGAYCLSLRLHPRERIKWLEAALSAARSSGDRKAMGAHLGNLGNAYSNLGMTKYAIKHYEQHLALARDMGDRHGEGQALGNLGNAYAHLGETHRAVKYNEQRLVIARETTDRRGEGVALGNLGNAYYALGQIQIAIEYQERALAIAREIADRRREGQALGSLGNAYADLGETLKAIGYFEQHLAIAREIGDRRGEGTTCWNMSLALDGLGDRDQAIAHAVAALRIYEEMEDPNAEVVRKQLENWTKEMPR